MQEAVSVYRHPSELLVWFSLVNLFTEIFKKNNVRAAGDSPNRHFCFLCSVTYRPLQILHYYYYYYYYYYVILTYPVVEVEVECTVALHVSRCVVVNIIQTKYSVGYERGGGGGGGRGVAAFTYGHCKF